MRISDWSSDVCSSDLVSMTPRLAIFRLALLATSAFIRTRLNKKEFSYDDTRKQRNGRRAARAIALPADGKHLGALGRTAERRVGKGGVSTSRSRWSPAH